ncbi:MAG: ATP/GTP-binding protein [Ignisphaera sp.]|uniref:GTPase n=1 Tax=Ignisphaera aggregans TaxID=334771 RepID=A0A7J3MWC9_9CREN
MTTKTIAVFIGPAGSGKSTTVYAYSKWLYREFGYKTYKVNLDPAAIFIPYEHDYDIRIIINIDRISKEYRLGPNGALVKSMDIISSKIDDIIHVFKDIDNQFILIDTPGQMEIFLFRDIAYKLMNSLKKYFRHVVAIFVTDAEVMKRYEDYAFLAIMTVAIQTRLGVDVIPVINKIDIANVDKIVGDIISDVDTITKHLMGQGVYGEMMSNILNTIAMYTKVTRIPKISAKNLLGLEELHRLIHEITCVCGDLT